MKEKCLEMSSFTENSLCKFHELCAEGIDFGEGPIYDFARCVRKDGSIYGISTGEVCRDGKPIPDKKQSESKGDGGGRMAKLRLAFIKKWGREMTPQEAKKAQYLLARGGVSTLNQKPAEGKSRKTQTLPKKA